jgi:hypothetical protein
MVDPGNGSTDEGIHTIAEHEKDLIACAKHAGVRERIDIHVAVNGTGTITSTASSDASPNVRCVLDAVSAVAFPGSLRGTSFDVAITVGP